MPETRRTGRAAPRGSKAGWRRTLLAAAGLWFVAGPAAAAELVMFEAAGCAWCARWRAEIGPIYPKTAEGKAAPLRRVDLGEPMPADLKGLTRPAFTPTFVLLNDAGEETARIVGYTGEAMFWWILAEPMAALLRPAPGGG